MISTMDAMLKWLMMDSLVDSATCWRRKSFLHVHVLACGMLARAGRLVVARFTFEKMLGYANHLKVCTARPLEIFHKRAPTRV